MSETARLKAALYRRLASIPTNGGHCTNRILTGLAERLEQDAERTERDQRHANTVSAVPVGVSKPARR
jgi:hypothetical protein